MSNEQVVADSKVKIVSYFAICYLVFIICLAVIFLFSCAKKKENTAPADAEAKESGGYTESAEEIEQKVMKEFIYNNDLYFEETDAEIEFIKKANFGIPGGDNWIVRLNSLHILIYVIDGGRIEEDYYGTISGQYFVDQYPEVVSEYDIMLDIPGTHIPDGCTSFGDFNGDGTDELFRYLYTEELGHNIDIFHYEQKKNGFDFCRIRHKIIDQEKGPAPVVFMTYRGKKGFKVYSGTGWNPNPDPAPDPKNDKWIFYSWNEEQSKYVEAGEVEG